MTSETTTPESPSSEPKRARRWLQRAPLRPPRPPLIPGEETATEVPPAVRELAARALAAPARRRGPAAAELAPPTLPIEAGALTVSDRETFEALSRRDAVPGALGIRELKILVTGVDTEDPTVYFVNTQSFQYHYDFARYGLRLSLSLREFNSQTYFTDNRRFIAGSLLAHDSFLSPAGERGLYALEFWPTDPVRARHVKVAYQLVRDAMPFAAPSLAYHPAGETQRELFRAEEEELSHAGVRTISTEVLFAQVTYSPLNLGQGYGLLGVLEGAEARPPSVRDVVIFKLIPNDLSHVAGVLTEEPQTPLSHINLKAKQNDTPNAYVKNASEHPRIATLVGKLVRLEVAPDDIAVREATRAEADEFLESVRPAKEQKPARDLDRQNIAPLKDLGHSDLAAYGAKAANLAELLKILPAGIVPHGFAVPFYFYDRFMRENDLYERAAAMMADPDFRRDPAEREHQLAKLKKRIRKKGDVPQDLLQALDEMHASFPPSTTPRCRSSTNNEDLEGFNGAGLYDSYTHRLDEGHIEKSIRQVWASLWNYRAFEERDFYRIDHQLAAMAVLVHPNFDDEKANGVAVTKNIYDPNWEGYYINVQVGEELVTNPEAGATPDELLVSAIGPSGEFEVQYIRHSSLVESGETVLTGDQIESLVEQLRRIQTHFQGLYGRAGDPSFAMDVEFKIDVEDRLVIKQARPWVD